PAGVPAARIEKRASRRHFSDSSGNSPVLQGVLDVATLYRNRLIQDRGGGDRGRNESLRRAVFRPGGVPRTEPAVLQGARRRGIRTGLRNRACVPGGASCHLSSLDGVLLARSRNGV